MIFVPRAQASAINVLPGVVRFWDLAARVLLVSRP